MPAQIRLYRVLIDKVMVFIQKEKNACTGRFFAFNAMFVSFSVQQRKKTSTSKNFLCYDRVCRQPQIVQKSQGIDDSFFFSFLPTAISDSLY
jgi:uncharacterized membrane protein